MSVTIRFYYPSQLTTDDVNVFLYLISFRWWFEQIGFWGAPGTPPPDEKTPVDIYPINIPAMPKDDYKKIYPNGVDKPYSSMKSATDTTTKSGLKGFVNDTMMSLGFSFVIGGILGGGIVALLLKNSKGYTAIN